MSGSLNKEGLLELLDELSERLRRKKTRASIYIVGGVAMALAFDRSRTTHDIDARIDARHRRTTSTHGSTHDIDARIDARHRRTTSTHDIDARIDDDIDARHRGTRRGSPPHREPPRASHELAERPGNTTSADGTRP